MIVEMLKAGGTVAVGVLIGLAIMSWVAPDTTGGQLLIVVVSALLTVALVSAARFVVRRFKRRKPSS
jgi:phosphotransferase system  glucose/maltose/N-acetylglucosamine-specific IIC component